MAKNRSDESAKHAGASFFRRHQVKCLNFLLILYLSVGAFLFDQLEVFEGGKRNVQIESINGKHNDKSAKLASLSEMRSSSVQRMWSITNQLNILYEANWTSLVLRELISFEQQLMDAMEVSSMDLEELELELEASRKKDDDFRRKIQQQKRAKSIKKSIIHSLATVTTMASPNGSPKGHLARLASVLYGALGVPLLLLTILKTGQRLALSSMNALIVIRHYCFKLPSYYLCCSCRPLECLRWLSWCFCCCCCCCRFLFCVGDNFSSSNKRQSPPKLVLRRRTKDADLEGGSLSCQYRSGADQVHPPNVCPSRANQHKSVRFDSCEPKSNSFATTRTLALEEFAGPREEHFRCSWGLFKTSLFLLVIYFLIGAYYNAQGGGSSLVDSVYDCYAMLSTSQLSEAFRLEAAPSDPLAFYRRMSSRSSESPLQLMRLERLREQTDGEERMIVNMLFILFGLNLISACVHLASLCCWSSAKRGQRAVEMKLCNGHIATVMGNLEGGNLFTDAHQQPPRTSALASQLERQEQEQYGCLFAAEGAPNMAGSLTSGLEGVREQVDLAEVFVIGQEQGQSSAGESSSLGVKFQQRAQQVGQHVLQDVSFASDRSTANSLCLHHQQSQLASPLEMVGFQPACELGTLKRRSQQQLHQLANGAHLYIPGQNSLLSPANQLAPEEEAGRVLEGLPVEQHFNGLSLSEPSESLSSQFAQASALTLSDNAGQLGLRTNGLGRLRLQNGCEPDASLNTVDTNSNTISSVSSRTVKLGEPQKQPQQFRHFGYCYSVEPAIPNDPK